MYYTRFGCEKCNVNFSNERLLTRHLSTSEHNDAVENYIYNCSLCSAKCPDINSFRIHHKTKHVVQARHFECDDCHKKFNQKCSLQRHIVSHHLSKASNKFYCRICCSRYPTVEKLRTHKERHMKYKCDVCGRMLRVSFSLLNRGVFITRPFSE
jgi:KRAB domain-containing zinc finger protein